MKNANSKRAFPKILLLSCILGGTLGGCAYFKEPKNAEGLIVPIHHVSKTGVGAYKGAVKFYDSDQGLLIQPHLSGLAPGPHGFHIHEHPDCGPRNGVAAAQAGGHYDPDERKTHRGPHSKEGHRGDLPALQVDAQGLANTRMRAPHLKVKDLYGRSVVIHEGGDNYKDTPEKLGGGGARIACGVLPLKGKS